MSQQRKKEVKAVPKQLNNTDDIQRYISALTMALQKYDILKYLPLCIETNKKLTAFDKDPARSGLRAPTHPADMARLQSYLQPLEEAFVEVEKSLITDIQKSTKKNDLLTNNLDAYHSGKGLLTSAERITTLQKILTLSKQETTVTPPQSPSGSLSSLPSTPTSISPPPSPLSLSESSLSESSRRYSHSSSRELLFAAPAPIENQIRKLRENIKGSIRALLKTDATKYQAVCKGANDKLVKYEDNHEDFQSQDKLNYLTSVLKPLENAMDEVAQAKLQEYQQIENPSSSGR